MQTFTSGEWNQFRQQLVPEDLCGRRAERCCATLDGCLPLTLPLPFYYNIYIIKLYVIKVCKSRSPICVESLTVKAKTSRHHRSASLHYIHPSIKSKNNFLVLWMSFIIEGEGRSKQFSSLKAKQLFYKEDMSNPPEDYLMKRLSVFIHTDSCWSGTVCPSDLICVTARMRRRPDPPAKWPRFVCYICHALRYILSTSALLCWRISKVIKWAKKQEQMEDACLRC